MLEDIVLAGDSLLFLQKKVVGARDLVVLIILDEGRGLLEVVAIKVVPQLIDKF